jgi:hypothetical protein
MMNNELKVGNLSLLVACLFAQDLKVTLDTNGTVTVFTDTSEIDLAREKMNERRQKCIDPRERDRILCQFQSSHQYMLGAWHYMLGTNIYGYAVGESLRSNLGGGTWSRTPRGLTLAEAIQWGCKQARDKNVRFSFGLRHLPQGVMGPTRVPR